MISEEVLVSQVDDLTMFVAVVLVVHVFGGDCCSRSSMRSQHEHYKMVTFRVCDCKSSVGIFPASKRCPGSFQFMRGIRTH